jgi:HEAT repeat protein
MPDIAAVVRRLADKDPQRRKSARREIAALGAAAVPALAAALCDRRRAGEAAEALARLATPEAAAALLKGLDQPADPRDPADLHRLAIAHALRRAAVPESAPGVRRRLAREPGPTMLARVLVQTLAGMGTADGVRAAIDVFVDDARFAREDFVHLLDPLRLEPVHVAVVFPRVLSLLTDPARGNAVIVLANAYHYAGARPHPLAERVTELTAALDAAVPDRATLAAHALGLIADGAAEPALRAKADGAGDVWLRAEAALALARMNVAEGRAALERLRGDAEAGDWAGRRLAELGPPRIEV